MVADWVCIARDSLYLTNTRGRVAFRCLAIDRTDRSIHVLYYRVSKTGSTCHGNRDIQALLQCLLEKRQEGYTYTMLLPPRPMHSLASHLAVL